MSATSIIYSAGNKLYKYAFPIYRPFYRAFKVYTDRAERRVLRKVLSPGAVVVDAGANIGIYSEFLSRCVGLNGVVHSFEPSPDNFKQLRSATRKLANVRLSQAAVGERTAKSELYLSDKLNVDHRTYMPDGDSRRTLAIEMVALDDYFEPGKRVDLIKIDIQGYELHALRGAQRVLKKNPEIQLLLEFWPYALEQAGTHWKQLTEMLQGLGMDVAFVRSERLTPFQASNVRTDSSWYVNL